MNFSQRKNGVWFLLCLPVLILSMAATAQAQVPPDIEAGLRKIGQIVDPACTAKLYRPLMPKNDYNTYWPVGASAPANLMPLYPGVTIARDVSFGPHPKDLVDIFSSDKGAGNRTVLIYVPGGGGNKIEQQDREANAFYDNIGRWAVKNDMVAVTMQRHPGENWDDGGKDISKMIQWLQANIAKYKGNPDRMFIWAHSAGNGPLGVYIGHPELHGPKGPGVKGAIFMSGNPVPGVGGPELDAGVNGGMLPSDIALQDELCKERKYHCPMMLYLNGESHMSEVFSIDTPDKTVSGPILAWMKKVK